MELGTLIAVIGLLVGTAISLPALLYQRRQTLLALEAKHEQTRHKALTASQNYFERMLSCKQLRVGYVHYPPFATAPVDDDDPPSGFYIDMIRELCDRNGIEAIFSQVRFSSAIKCILDDEQDIVLSIFQTPRRTRSVDFTAFLHSVSVSGVTRKSETRLSSQADIIDSGLRFVVCREEIGHEILEEQMKIASRRLDIIDTSNIADIIEWVAAGKADAAIADSLSCRHGLAARGAEGPKLKAIFRKRPLYLCPNGVMLAKGQEPLATWLEKGLKKIRLEPHFQETEKVILKNFENIISRL